MSRKNRLEIDILTLFPEMFKGPLSESLLGKAQSKDLVKIRLHNLRDYTSDKHRKVDDRVFGGGSGMLIQVEPLYKALKSLGALGPGKRRPHVIYLSPQGERLTQALVREIADTKWILLICGHYEGIDERATKWVDREISIGDYVLTGGEIPAMVLVDAVSRMVPGVVKEWDSVKNDSFYDGLLDSAHYTRPRKFLGMEAPQVLLSGNHLAIESWRKKDSLERTLKKRPDLLRN